jgi:hypothetical protein
MGLRDRMNVMATDLRALRDRVRGRGAPPNGSAGAREDLPGAGVGATAASPPRGTERIFEGLAVGIGGAARGLGRGLSCLALLPFRVLGVLVRVGVFVFGVFIAFFVLALVFKILKRVILGMAGGL